MNTVPDDKLTVESVDFFMGTKLIGTLSQAPYVVKVDVKRWTATTYAARKAVIRFADAKGLLFKSIVASKDIKAHQDKDLMVLTVDPKLIHERLLELAD
jgi:hypothetical protein